MTKYQITNRHTGYNLGTRSATSPRDAIVVMARDAGYEDYDAEFALALFATARDGNEGEVHYGPLTVVEVAS